MVEASLVISKAILGCNTSRALDKNGGTKRGSNISKGDVVEDLAPDYETWSGTAK